MRKRNKKIKSLFHRDLWFCGMGIMFLLGSIIFLLSILDEMHMINIRQGIIIEQK